MGSLKKPLPEGIGPVGTVGTVGMKKGRQRKGK
jgi:hypothetical protein